MLMNDFKEKWKTSGALIVYTVCDWWWHLAIGAVITVSLSQQVSQAHAKWSLRQRALLAQDEEAVQHKTQCTSTRGRYRTWEASIRLAE